MLFIEDTLWAKKQFAANLLNSDEAEFTQITLLETQLQSNFRLSIFELGSYVPIMTLFGFFMSWTKATNIDLINRYGEWFGLDYVVVYFYNVYGGRQVKQGQYATLIALWKERLRNKQKLQIVLPGTQVRAFTYIDDIVRGIILAGQKGKGDGYPLGCDQTFSLWEVGQIFGVKNKQDFEILAQRPGDRKTAVIDLEKTRNELGWTAETRLGDHIKKFLEDLQK